MSAGLRPEFVSLIRCPADGAELRVVATSSTAAGHVVSGALTCRCGQSFPIVEGIAVMLPRSQMNTDSEYEKSQRDIAATVDDFDWETAGASRSEMASTLAALGPCDGKTILELGCGRGRFTRLMSGARAIVALDFSFESLRKVAARVAPDAPILLVCADVTWFKTQPGAFDRVFSTLTSNLPTREHRDAMNRLAAEALRPDGSFVLSAHYFGLREWLLKEPKGGYYPGSRIFRQLFTRAELRAEMAPFFAKQRLDRIQVTLPLIARFGMARWSSPRFAEKLPGVNLLASLLLVTARAPQRAGAPR
jgi:uncharacterized protein YbaR (Trm112 family)/predicted RNA methylase